MTPPPDPNASTFLVDGRAIHFEPGWTVAAAIAADGDPWLRRSVRDMPRGALCGMGICHECRVVIDGVPHRRACRVVARAGMVVRRDAPEAPGMPDPGDGNPSGTRRADRPADAGVAAPIATGAASTATIVVVGAGPAGLAAAAAVAARGVAVTLLDAEPDSGGQIWRRGPSGSPAPEVAALEATLPPARVSRSFDTEVIDAERIDTDTTGPAPSDQGRPDASRFRLFLRVNGIPAVLDATTVILATGAQERFLPFPGWTLPGVSGVGGLQSLVKRGLPVTGRRVLIAGSGPLSLAVADLLRRRGAELVAIAESASPMDLLRLGLATVGLGSKLREGLGYAWRLRSVPRRIGWWVAEATGDDRVRRVILTDGDRTTTFDVDLLAAGAGLVPRIELAARLGAALRTDHGDPRVEVDPDQRTSVPGLLAAGELTGVGGSDRGLAEGRLAGAVAAGAPEDILAPLRRDARRWRGFASALARATRPRRAMLDAARDDTILCRCEDVVLGDVRRYPDWRTAKLQTRVGMGPCQGRVCGTAARAILGWTVPVNRPPVSPTSIESLIADGRAATVGSADRPAPSPADDATDPGDASTEEPR